MPLLLGRCFLVLVKQSNKSTMIQKWKQLEAKADAWVEARWPGGIKLMNCCVFVLINIAAFIVIVAIILFLRR